MDQVFVLHHSYEKEPCGHDEVKMIGVYASQQSAEAALAQLKDKPGFRDYPDGFCIDTYKLGRTWWSDGFGVDPADR